jgi:diaminohydroxyphosphoribosylaminopyrimidine deaminase/5-amino-6-(5-phosphoribosylamino)uracil reductase
VLTGIGTVLQDDPVLNVREVPTPRQPQLVVVDSRLQTPPDASLFIADRACTIYSAGTFDSEFSDRKAMLEARGATVVQLPGADGRVDLPAMLHDLAARGVNELHVEAGHRLNGALVRAGLVDELLLYLAPQLLGPGRGMADMGPLEALAQGLPLQFQGVERVGPDLRVLARVAGRDAF